MREHTSPIPAVEVNPDDNLTSSLWDLARSAPDRPTAAYRDEDRFVTWTARRFVDEVRAVAKGFIALGIEPGQRVAVYAATRLEWTVLDYAVWAAGAVTVPIYDTSSADQVEWNVSDSEAVAIVVGTKELKHEYDQVADRLPGCEHVFVLDDGGLDELKRVGDDITDDELQRRAERVTGDDVATIVYTSGTTGPPKGCVLTHHNLVWSVAQTERCLDELLEPGKTTLLFLPLAHILSRIIQVVCIRTGVLLGFASSMDHLREELREFQPSFLLAVPRVFEKVLSGAQRKAHDEGRGWIFDRAMSAAETHSRQRATGSVRPLTRLQHWLYDRLVYGRLRDALGGEVEYAVSGGAALGTSLAHTFRGIGIEVLEGYGLTETTAPATINRPDTVRVGTVGQPLPGVTIAIDDDGEILVKGGNVFQGYHDNEEATAEAFDDGWFRTEDLGDLDDDGFLTITGRKKDLIVTAGGKNVAPGPLEDRLRAHPLISETMLVGEGRPFIGALVALDPDELADWARDRDTPTSIEEAADDAALRAEIQAVVDEANRAVSRAERIREFRIVPDELTLEEGELTPTMKVKREVVADRYGELIHDIYADV